MDSLRFGPTARPHARTHARFVELALRLLLLNKQKKSENDVVVRFCSSEGNSKKWEKIPQKRTKNMATSTITMLNEIPLIIMLIFFTHSIDL